MTLNDIREEAIFSYTPDMDGLYVFASSDNYAFTIRGTLYDEHWNAVATNIWGGDDYNFRLCCNLEAGKLYFFGASYNQPNTGSFEVRLEKLSVTPLTVDAPATATVSRGGQIACFSFEPQVTGDYSFTSFAGEGEYMDTYGSLYDANMQEIAHDDDGGENSHFRITHRLTAHETYYLAARFYNDDTTGAFQVCLTAADNT